MAADVELDRDTRLEVSVAELTVSRAATEAGRQTVGSCDAAVTSNRIRDDPH